MSQTKRKKAEPDLLAKSSTKNDNSKVKIMEEEDETVTERMEREEQEREFRELHDTTWVSKEASETKTGHEIHVQINDLYLAMPRISKKERANLERFENERWVSEAEHQAKIKEVEANELKAMKLAEKVVGENAKLKKEIEHLNLTCSKQIYWEQETKIKELETEIDNRRVSMNDAVRRGDTIIEELEERLEAIKQHWEQMPKENQSIYWTSTCDDEIQDEFIGHKFFTDLQKWYQELGVLLSEPTFLPKKLDQKTEYEKCKFNPKDDCNDCEFEGCPNWGASLEEQDIEKSEPKELDQKTREGDPK